MRNARFLDCLNEDLKRYRMILIADVCQFNPVASLRLNNSAPRTRRVCGCEPCREWVWSYEITVWRTVHAEGHVRADSVLECHCYGYVLARSEEEVPFIVEDERCCLVDQYTFLVVGRSRTDVRLPWMIRVVPVSSCYDSYEGGEDQKGQPDLFPMIPLSGRLSSQFFISLAEGAVDHFLFAHSVILRELRLRWI